MGHLQRKFKAVMSQKTVFPNEYFFTASNFVCELQTLLISVPVALYSSMLKFFCPQFMHNDFILEENIENPFKEESIAYIKMTIVLIC